MKHRKNFAKFGLCLILTGALLLSITSCKKSDSEDTEQTDEGSAYKKAELKVDEDLTSFSYDPKADLYTDSKTGITYHPASLSYEPVTMATGYGQVDSTSVILYRLEGCSEQEWLTMDYNATNFMLYADSISLPTLAQMNADSMLICDQDAVVIARATVTDVEVLQKLIRLSTTGKEVDLPREIDLNTEFRLKFSSTDYPMFYYMLVYYQDDDGRPCVYDRGTKRAVEIGDLLKPYLPDSTNG